MGHFYRIDRREQFIFVVNADSSDIGAAWLRVDNFTLGKHLSTDALDFKRQIQT
ncbi:hypothetical protein SAMN05216597_4443 [Pseudomonas cannabina]|nr:hypothetical protein SAMN05216597_4443 [Pseudomonas cannabina]